jgi:hypothetical protein
MTSCNFPLGAGLCSLPCDPQGHYQHRCPLHQTNIDEIFERHRRLGETTGKYCNTYHDPSTNEYIGYALSEKQILHPNPGDTSADAFWRRLRTSQTGLETMHEIRVEKGLTAGELKILEACQFAVAMHWAAFEGMENYEAQLNKCLKFVIDEPLSVEDAKDMVVLLASLKANRARIVETWHDSAQKHHTMHIAAFRQDMAETGFSAEEIEEVFAQHKIENRRNTLPLEPSAHRA